MILPEVIYPWHIDLNDRYIIQSYSINGVFSFFNIKLNFLLSLNTIDEQKTLYYLSILRCGPNANSKRDCVLFEKLKE